MLFISNVPVVIEPGVAALEADLSIKAPEGERDVQIHLTRVPLDEKSAADLPFIPSAKLPHVFAPTANLKTAHTLVVYDFLGRLAVIYTKEKNVWERNNVSDEHAGKTVTQFSVRFCFNSVKNRDKFLAAMEHMAQCASEDREPSPEAILDASRLLARSRTAPVVLPVAVAKKSLGKIKL